MGTAAGEEKKEREGGSKVSATQKVYKADAAIKTRAQRIAFAAAGGLAGWQEMRGSAPANTYVLSYSLLVTSSYSQAKREKSQSENFHRQR